MRRGRHYWAHCPIHPEKTPSFSVNPEQQRWYCFGCHKGGDVITFIRELRGCSFPEALRHLGIAGNCRPPAPDAKAIRKRGLVQEFREWERQYLRYLFDEIQSINRLQLKSVAEVEEFALVLQSASDVEREIWILTEGTDEDKYRLYCEVNDIV